jgi:hypothetical protein
MYSLRTVRKIFEFKQRCQVNGHYENVGMWIHDGWNEQKRVCINDKIKFADTVDAHCYNNKVS